MKRRNGGFSLCDFPLSFITFCKCSISGGYRSGNFPVFKLLFNYKESINFSASLISGRESRTAGKRSIEER
jgi:hypothetical protein